MTKKSINYRSLTEVLRELDKNLSGYPNVRLVAIGGTALNLIGLKSSTFDIDFILENDNPLLKAEILYYLDKRGYSCHLQDRGRIVSYDLPPDYFTRARVANKINQILNHIEIYVMNPVDLVISKLARFNAGDKEDITQLILRFNPSWSEIRHRFVQFCNLFQGNKANLKHNFNLFSSLFKELKRKKK